MVGRGSGYPAVGAFGEGKGRAAVAALTALRGGVFGGAEVVADGKERASWAASAELLPSVRARPPA